MAYKYASKHSKKTVFDEDVIDPVTHQSASSAWDPELAFKAFAKTKDHGVGKTLHQENTYRVVHERRPDKPQKDHYEPESDDEENVDYLVEKVTVTLQQKFGGSLSDTLRQLSQPTDTEEISERFLSAVTEKIPRCDSPEPEDANSEINSGIGCAYCSTERRVEDARMFKPGQQINMPGEWFTFNFGNTLVKLYSHHAIIKDVISANQNEAKLILIHFTKKKGKIGIYETKEDIKLSRDEINIVDYQHPKYSPDKIIERAERKLSEKEQFGSYSVCMKNCEHFATWCVVGEEESLQVTESIKCVSSWIAKIIGFGETFIFKILREAADEIARGIRSVPDLPLFYLKAAGLLYLVFCIVETLRKVYLRQNKKLCQACFRKDLIRLWCGLGMFVSANAVTYLIAQFALPLLTTAWPTLAVLVVVSLALQWKVSKVIDALLFPLTVDKIPVKRIGNIKIGDILDIPYWGFSHTVVVTGVETGKRFSKEGQIRCIHYGLSRFFGTREVIEEDILVIINKKTGVYKLDDRFLSKYTPQEVVSRARMRVGEQKWHPLNNRSDHLAIYSKVKEERLSENIHVINVPSSDTAEGDKASSRRSSFFVGKCEIHQRYILKPGEVLEMNGKLCMLMSLLNYPHDTERNFEVEVVTVTYLLPSVKHTRVNLNKDRIYVLKYIPAQCCSLSESVDRARRSVRCGQIIPRRGKFFENLKYKTY